jgi:hypothetical protein
VSTNAMSYTFRTTTSRARQSCQGGTGAHRRCQEHSHCELPVSGRAMWPAWIFRWGRIVRCTVYIGETRQQRFRAHAVRQLREAAGRKGKIRRQCHIELTAGFEHGIRFRCSSEQAVVDLIASAADGEVRSAPGRRKGRELNRSHRRRRYRKCCQLGFSRRRFGLTSLIAAHPVAIMCLERRWPDAGCGTRSKSAG